LSQDVLDTPRLSKIIQENDLYPALRRTKPMPDVVERMRKDIAHRREGAARAARPRVELAGLHGGLHHHRSGGLRPRDQHAGLAVQRGEPPAGEQQAVGTSEFLETQLRELRGKLAGQEQKITAYKEQHLGELPEQKEVNLRTLERLQQQLSLAYENNRRATERRQNISQSMNNLDLASAMAGSPGAASIAGPAVTPAESAAARLSILRQELAALQTTYSDKYPDVIQMKEQIRLTERRAAEEEEGRGGRRRAQDGRPSSDHLPPEPRPRAGREQPLRAEPDAAARPGQRRGQGEHGRDR
jgi:hypothetical protein